MNAEPLFPPATPTPSAVHPSEEETLRLLIDSVEDYAIYLMDADGRIISWNTGAERIKGYTASEIIGKHFSCFFPEGDKASGKPQRLLEAAAREGRVEDEAGTTVRAIVSTKQSA